MPKYVFVCGGVMSGVGKGIASASIGKILQSRGFRVTALKIDPYINVDAGTMNPTEHGEVFVLNDGTECDQDMGNYERFLGSDLSGANYMTTGSIYLSVIEKERRLEYKGKFVSVVPYIPLEVINRIDKALKKNDADIVITEIGGTVGEYENLLFLEAVKMLKIKKQGDVVLVLVSHLPLLGEGGNELKTKPTQHAVRALNSAGLQPDIIIARAKVPIDKKRKEKIAFHCSMREQDVISAPDIKSIYEVPINFEKDHISDAILEKLSLKPKNRDMIEWRKMVQRITNASQLVYIGIVGKYFGTGEFMLVDSYISVIEAIKHAAGKVGRKPVIDWLNAEDFDPTISKNYESNLKKLKKYNGLIVPGGFGSRGVEGKIKVVEFCRRNKIPYLGLCYGLQMAVIEFARHVCGLKDAHTTEVNPETKNPVIHTMADQVENINKKQLGGTMRLGSYTCELKSGTVSAKAYHQKLIIERHRHRYEVNNEYRNILENKGMIFSGINPDKNLVEIIELKNHPFFVGTQFHPEFKSRPLDPHPLFVAFIKAATIKK